MANKETLDNDLNIIMKDFHHLQEFYFQEQRSKTDLQHLLQTLKEQIKFMKDTERKDQYKLNECHNLIALQQETISKLFDVKDENQRLLEQSNNLKGCVAKLETRLISEEADKEFKLMEVTEEYEKKLKNLQESFEQEVHSLKNELELAHSELQKTCSVSSLKLESFQDEKIEEMNIIVEIYEEKVSKLEKDLAMSEVEKKRTVERAAANIAIYKKKVMELEETFGFYQIHPLPSTSNSTFKFHEISNYGQQNNEKQFSNPSIVDIESRESKNKLQAIMCSATDNMQSCQTVRTNTDTLLDAPTSVNSLKFLETASKAPTTEVNNDIVRKRKTMFPLVKKRKLFSHVDKNE